MQQVDYICVTSAYSLADRLDRLEKVEKAAACIAPRQRSHAFQRQFELNRRRICARLDESKSRSSAHPSSDVISQDSV